MGVISDRNATLAKQLYKKRGTGHFMTKDGTGTGVDSNPIKRLIKLDRFVSTL